MIVSELIEKLKLLPQDYRVLVTGYEGDLENPHIKAPNKRLVHLDYDEGGYCGPHKECGAWRKIGGTEIIQDWECFYCTETKKPPVWIVLIGR